jgi:centrosomal protein CEP104
MSVGVPGRLPFRVVHCTSCDEGFPPQELESTGAPSKGWQSARFCTFPQEIILQFACEVELDQIQVLSHQFMIPAKIDVSIATAPDLSLAKFKRLGYMSLDTNERSNFKLRELKSVTLHCRGNLLKLDIRKCHVNASNLFNQVSIIAIHATGRALGAVAGAAPGPAAAAPLGFEEPGDAEFDPQTQQQLRQLQAAKARAIQAEDYDEAKRLKHAIGELRKVGGSIAELERRKRHAVEVEDFDLAKQLKLEIDALKTHLLSPSAAAAGRSQPASAASRDAAPLPRGGPRTSPTAAAGASSLTTGGGDLGGAAPAPALSPSGSLGDMAGGVSPHGGEVLPARSASRQGESAAVSAYDERPLAGQKAPLNAEDLEKVSDPFGKRRSGRTSGAAVRVPAGALQPSAALVAAGMAADLASAESRKSPAAIAGSSNPNDDRPLPTSERKQAAAADQAGAADESRNAAADPSQPEPIPPAMFKDAEPLIAIFSEHHVRCLFSKQWNLREGALQHIQQELTQARYSSSTPQQLLHGLARVLRISCKDKHAKVSAAAMALLDAAVETLAPQAPHEVSHSLGGDVLHAVAEMLGESNARVSSSASKALLTLSRNKLFGPKVVAEAALTIASEKEADKPMALLGRADLLATLVAEHRVEESGIPLAALMDFVRPLLTHRDARVRAAGIQLTTIVYGVVGAKKLAPLLKSQRPGIQEALNVSFKAAGHPPMEFASGPVAAEPPAVPVPGPSGKGPSPAKPQGGGRGAAAGGGRAAAAAAQQQQQAPQQGPSGGGGRGKDAKKAGAKGGVAPGGPAASAAKGAKPAAKGAAGAAGAKAGSETAQQQHASGQPPSSAAEGGGDKFCQFCGLADPAFTEEKLDMHYWQSCPMLTSCKLCEQVIEIPGYTEHLLTECEFVGQHKMCPRCKEAIPRDAAEEHILAAFCPPAKPPEQANRCPLCHTDIPPGVEGWKKHLMQDGCPKNDRAGVKRPQ